MATYSISELAHEFNVTPRALRFYEDQGLLTPTRQGTTRIYNQRDRTRLKLTIRGKRLGLSLADIRSLLDMYETPSDSQAQMNKLVELIGRYRDQLNQQMKDVRETLDELDSEEQRVRSLLSTTEAPVTTP